MIKKVEKVGIEVKLLTPTKSEQIQGNVILIYNYEMYVGGGSNWDSSEAKYIKEAKKIIGWKRCFHKQVRFERTEDKQYQEENNVTRIIDLRYNK